MGQLLVERSSRKYPNDLSAIDQSFRKADGLFYIEPELLNRYHPARASQFQVVDGAKVVIDGCIRDKIDPKGGSANRIGELPRSGLRNALGQV